jgi:hypothetical protein
MKDRKFKETKHGWEDIVESIAKYPRYQKLIKFINEMNEDSKRKLEEFEKQV